MDREAKRAYNRAHYQRNKRYYIDKAQKVKDETRSLVRDLKARTPCQDCNQQYPSYVMDFDHRDGDDKVGDINQLILRRSRQQVLAEIAKCDIVCSNCHRIRTHSRLLSRGLP